MTTMAPKKQRSGYTPKSKRKVQIAHMRACKGKGVTNESCDAPSPVEIATTPAPAQPTEVPILPMPTSTSQRMFQSFTPTSTLAEEPKLPTTVVDLNCIVSLFEGVVCKTCKQSGLLLKEGSGSKALSVHLKLWCPTCEDYASEGYTSRRSSQTFQINRRAVASAVSAGMGHGAFSRFCEGLGMSCINHVSYHKHLDNIFEMTNHVRDSYMEQAREVIRDYYKLNQPDAFGADNILNIAVSYDGSWLKRGHTSKLGVCAVIDLGTGLALDFHVMSLYCQLCCTTTQKNKLGEEEYGKWLKEHQESGLCRKNYTGSSGGMEVAGALTLWNRSLNHGMRYTTLLGDGDTKAFLAITAAQPYKDVAITKEECVNHVAKRLGTGLRNLKLSLSKQSVRLGGRTKGSLTDAKIDLLQTYYTKAVRTCNNSVEDMKKAIYAAFYHSVSTNENPQHSYCPPGPESWCWFNKEIAKGIDKPSRPDYLPTTFLNDQVAQHVKEVYDRLAKPELLSRCLLGKTQNANEALHGVIWSHCPKHLWSGFKKVSIAATLAVGEFNMGATAFQQFLSAISGSVTATTLNLGTKRDKRRKSNADKSEQLVEKKRRECRRQAAAKYQKDMQNIEGGASYSAGGF